MRLPLFAALIAFAPVVQAPAAMADDITVFAAASLKTALDQIGLITRGRIAALLGG